MALHPFAPQGAHPCAVPDWRTVLNQDIQKLLLLQAGTSQSLFHELLQVQQQRTGAVCVASALFQLQSVPVLLHTGTPGSIHSPNTGKNMHSHSHPWGAEPWQNQASLQP